MSLRWALLLLLGLSGCLSLTLPPNKPLARPVAFRGAYEEFSSGLRLVVHENPQLSRVTMNVSYRVGATDEPIGKEGLAHLVEHLTFMARPGGARAPRLSSRLLASGAEYNAATSHDGTDYFSAAPPEQFPGLVALEAARLREPLGHVTEEDFRVAREVVVAELRQRYETSPEGAQQRWLHETLLAGHPYGRLAGGTPESLQGLTLEDARAFVKAHYTPAHAVVVVAGPLPSEQVRAVVASGFTDLTDTGQSQPTPAVRRVAPPFPADPPERPPMVVKHGPVEYPRLWLVWTLPGLYSGQTPQAFAAQGILGARLLQQISREQRAHNASVSLQVMDGVALLIARIDLMKEEDAKAVAEFVLDQLVFVGRTLGVGAGTVASRLSLLAEAFSQLEQFPVREAARFLRATGQADYVSGWPRQIEEALSKDLSHYLYQYVRRQRARILLVVPERAGAGRTVVGERFAPLAASEDFGDEELILPPGTPDVRQVARPPGLDKAERFVLENGLQVVALRRGIMPLVEARLRVRTRLPGADGGSLALPHVAVLGSYMSAVRTWRHGEKVGARSEFKLREEGQVVLDMAAPSGNLVHVLEDIQQWLSDAEVELRPFEYVHAWQLRELEREAALSGTRAEQALRAHLFPGHPYGVAPSLEGARGLERSDANAWVEAELNPDRATLFLVGDLPPLPELRAQVGELLGSWRGRSAPLEEPPPPPPPGPREVVLVDRPGASQAELRVGLRWPELSAREDAAADALVWLLEHRLDRQLRERLGLTYGVKVSHEARPRASTMKVHAAVDRSAAAGALEQILAELGTLETEPLPREVVERARWQVARGYDLRFQTAASVVERLLELERLGRPADFWETYPEAIAAVTPESLQELVRRLSLGAEGVVLLGDAATLRPQLEGAGFQVQVLPAGRPGPPPP